MPNPFTEAYAPQTMPNQQYQPTMQDLSAQNAFTQQAMQQGQQLAQQAGQTNAGSGPAALAAMLRAGSKDKGDQTPAQQAWSGAKSFYNNNIQGYMPWNQPTPNAATEQQINQLGSNSWNPLSDFNTGANGWGSFGE